MKTKAFTLIRIVVSSVFIVVLVWIMRGKVDEVAGVIKNIDISLFITGNVFFILALIIISARLKYLLNYKNFQLNYREAASLTFVGYFFNNFLPTSMGGDVVKAYYISKKNTNKLGCFTTVFMDRLLGLFSLFLVAGLILIFSNPYAAGDSMQSWPIFIVLAVLVAFFFILWNRRLARKFLSPVLKVTSLLRLTKRLGLEEKLKRVYETVNSFKDKKVLIAWALAVSVTAQLICFFAVYFWAKGLGSPISMRIVLLTMPLVSILAILPSINGLGIRESAIVFFFGPHIGYQNAFALSLLWLFMLFLASVIGGLSYAFADRYKFK